MNFFTKVFVSPIKEIKEAIAKKRKDGINDNEFELQTAKPGYIYIMKILILLIVSLLF